MDLTQLKTYCLSKNGALEDYPFGRDVVVIKIISKMFALIVEKDGWMNLSLKCDPILADQLRQKYTSVIPGYHLNKNHWNTVIIDGTIPEQEIYWMIDHSYERVIKGLTKKQRASLEYQ